MTATDQQLGPAHSTKARLALSGGAGHLQADVCHIVDADREVRSDRTVPSCRLNVRQINCNSALIAS